MPVPTGTAGKTIPLRGIFTAWAESSPGNEIDQAEDCWTITFGFSVWTEGCLFDLCLRGQERFMEINGKAADFLLPV